MNRLIYQSGKKDAIALVSDYSSNLRVNHFNLKNLSCTLSSNRLLIKQSSISLRLENSSEKYKPYEGFLPLLSSANRFHTPTSPTCKDPESNAEKTANLLKENIIPKKDEGATVEKATEIGKSQTTSESKTQIVVEKSQIKKEPIDSSGDTKVENQSQIVQVKTIETVVATKSSQELETPKPTIWQRVVAELKHYYHGFRLLYLETKIAFRLLKQVLQGHTLTRRERKQFTRTAADLFRLVPFSVFIIVPFMEFTLPIFLKLFPNMLPSTFKEESKEQDKLKKRLKAKLEMAKFLQDTLEETALKAEKTHENSLNTKFAEFMKKIRSQGEQPTNEDIMKYSSLFENELTLDNLTRQQLIALCQILDVNTLANIPPNNILRFQLRMKIRALEADDRTILNEGIESLDISELQQACRDRGMRAVGVSEARLKKQLEQWLDLHLNRNIPISLLILSRALYLPENLPPEDLIKSTISVLPKSIENATMAKIAEVSGGKVDNQVKLELLKQEEAEIKLENISSSAEAAADEKKTQAVSPVPATKPAEILQPVLEKDFAAEQFKKEILIDKAPIIETNKIQESQDMLSPKEIKEITQIIENLPSNEKKQVKAEIEELKKDVTEYKEDIKEVEQLSAVPNANKLTETKSAKILSKRVQKLINDVDRLLSKLDKESNESTDVHPTSKNTVSVEELSNTIIKIRGASTAEKDKKLVDIFETLDKDKDGKIDDLNDVIKLFDIIEQENVKVSKTQLSKLLTVLEKEKILEIEEQQKQQNKIESTTTVNQTKQSTSSQTSSK